MFAKAKVSVCNHRNREASGSHRDAVRRDVEFELVDQPAELEGDEGLVSANRRTGSHHST